MRMRAVAVLVVAGAVLAGCGGAKSNGEASKPALRVVKDAVAAASSASGVHLSGTIVSGGDHLTIDLHIVEGKGGVGTITEQGLSFQFVRIGDKAYIKGTDAFYKKFAGAAAAQLLHDRWLMADATKGQFASLTELTDLAKLIPQVVNEHTKLANEGEKTVKGQKVVAIRDTAEGGTLYVAATGKPYPLEIVKVNGTEPGDILFDDWNKTVPITTPKDAIDLSKLGG
ncbi:MAG TPA: hypothetical protein VGH92_06050 [Gaiellaceae bacterium]